MFVEHQVRPRELGLSSREPGFPQIHHPRRSQPWSHAIATHSHVAFAHTEWYEHLQYARGRCRRPQKRHLAQLETKEGSNLIEAGRKEQRASDRKIPKKFLHIIDMLRKIGLKSVKLCYTDQTAEFTERISVKSLCFPPCVK